MTDKRDFAARRSELIARCAAQRHEAVGELHQLVSPFTGTGTGFGTGAGVGAALLQRLNLRQLKLPLVVGGAVLGLLLVRSRRALPVAASMVTAGVSVWKMARSALSALQRHGAI